MGNIVRDLSQAQKRNSFLTSPKQTKKEEAGEKTKAPEEKKEEEKKLLKQKRRNKSRPIFSLCP